MRVGIIGAGTIFKNHLAAHRACGQEVTIVVDIDSSRARTCARVSGIPNASSDWRELLDGDGVDVVDICTPPKYHAEVAIAALRAGKHVICEKPLAPTPAECDAIVRAAEESTNQLLTVHQYRYHPQNQRLKWLVDGGHLGRVCFARVVRYNPPPRSLVQAGVWGQWELTGGGVLMTKAVHQLDLLCWMLGRPQRVQAMMGTFLNKIESEDQLVANIQFGNGAQVALAVSGAPFRDTAQMDLIGTAGAAGRPWFLRLGDRSDERELNEELKTRFPEQGESRFAKLLGRVGRKLKIGRLTPRKPNLHEALFADFYRTIDNGDESPVTVHDACIAVELCTAIYASAIVGREVTLPLAPDDPFYCGVKREDYSGSREQRAESEGRSVSQ